MGVHDISEMLNGVSQGVYIVSLKTPLIEKNALLTLTK